MVHAVGAGVFVAGGGSKVARYRHRIEHAIGAVLVLLAEGLGATSLQ